MSRPLRIEFPGAWYHAMNRGAGYRDIFGEDEHRKMFLALLGEIHAMFRVETHAYCLMDNHYHLVLHTPEGNLQRAMRHLNGVYTQRYNRTTQSDGPLFRGRYKAILIEADAYLLNVSRYIHLNPVAAGLAEVPEDYPWSSYRAYLGVNGEPDWLSTQITLRMIGQRRQRERYRHFVEAGIDADTEAFYGKKKLSPIWGREAFRERISAGIEPQPEIPDSRPHRRPVALSAIVEAVAQVFGEDSGHILGSKRGRGHTSPARMAALYLARKLAGIPLDELADQFGLGSYGSVSGMVSRFARAVQSDEALARRIEKVAEKINAQT